MANRLHPPKDTGIKKEAPIVTDEDFEILKKFNLLDEIDKSYILGHIDAVLSKRK